MKNDATVAVTQLRHTETGCFRTRLFLVQSDIHLVDPDSREEFYIYASSQVLVLDPEYTSADLVERLLDWAELGLHASYSASVNGAAIRTVEDIRATERQSVGVDEVPF